MTEQMTPMQQTKNHFDIFANLIGKNFKQTNLNKSSSKHYVDYFCGDRTEHFNKGVRSDFVRLFQITKNEHVYALGFVFSFTEDPLNPLISVSCSDSYKDIKRFSKSVGFNVSDFKNKMNEVNSILNVLENASDDEILETIQIEFLGFNFLNEPNKRQSTRKARKNFK